VFRTGYYDFFRRFTVFVHVSGLRCETAVFRLTESAAWIAARNNHDFLILAFETQESSRRRIGKSFGTWDWVEIDFVFISGRRKLGHRRWIWIDQKHLIFERSKSCDIVVRWGKHSRTNVGPGRTGNRRSDRSTELVRRTYR